MFILDLVYCQIKVGTSNPSKISTTKTDFYRNTLLGLACFEVSFIHSLPGKWEWIQTLNKYWVGQYEAWLWFIQYLERTYG